MSQSTGKSADEITAQTLNEHGNEIDLDDAEELSSSPSIPDTEIDFEFVYALHTFVATVEGQASATKGDTLILLDDSNSYWWLVRVIKDQSVGYLPAEHIETPEERLARLNKHRNVELFTNDIFVSEELRKSYTEFISSRNDRAVQFTGMTYVDAPTWDLSEEFDSVASSSGSLRGTLMDENPNEPATNPTTESSSCPVDKDIMVSAEANPEHRTNSLTIADKPPLLDRNYPMTHRNIGQNTNAIGHEDANTLKSEKEIANIQKIKRDRDKKPDDPSSDDDETERTNLPPPEQTALIGNNGSDPKKTTSSENSEIESSPQRSPTNKTERRGGKGRIFGSLFKKRSPKKILQRDPAELATGTYTSRGIEDGAEVESGTDHIASSLRQKTELQDAESASDRIEPTNSPPTSIVPTLAESGDRNENEASSNGLELPARELLSDSPTSHSAQVRQKLDLKTVAAYLDTDNDMVQELIWIVRSRHIPSREDDVRNNASGAFSGFKQISDVSLYCKFPHL